MNFEDMTRLREMHLAPYMRLAAYLIGKEREGGGNMFRHQFDTMAILIDYEYIDPVLLKAALVHDLIEDVPDFNRNELLGVDYDSSEVYALVLEVTKKEGEKKIDFLNRIRNDGSSYAKLLKSADRISNMISLGFVNDFEFVERYTNETQEHVIPITAMVDHLMCMELEKLVKSRRRTVEILKRELQIVHTFEFPSGTEVPRRGYLQDFFQKISRLIGF